MASVELGYNQGFKIYNANGTQFNNLVLHKATYETVVMSLGDKISGIVYYKDNKLVVNMTEYIIYKDVKYVLVNPPTIIKEGLVSDNGELKGMTKYSFTFYHPMYMLSNFPFSDIAVNTNQQRYLSQNKTFSWIGNLTDYVAKLNKNLEGTQWKVSIGTNVTDAEKNKLSEVLSFDNNTIADALKTAYETWEIPYIIDQTYEGNKWFLIRFGLPTTEIYEVDEDGQYIRDDNNQKIPFVFKYGQGVGLKNNSRTPKNNKIVTRIAGYGSEDNIPYGYPQIVWTGNQDWDYTINNDSTATNSYPIYDGIVGGQKVRLIKHPFTRTHLMPPIYSETVNKKVNPNATGYDPDIELVDYYDANDNTYPNQIKAGEPSYEIHEFEDIKPEFGSLSITSATPYDGHSNESITQNEFLSIVDDLYTETDIKAEKTQINALRTRFTQSQSGSGKSTSGDYKYDWSFTTEGLYKKVKYASSGINFEYVVYVGQGQSPVTIDWDDTMDDEGNYVQSYFKVTIPQLTFDIYASAAITQEMTINMRSGACIGCSFPVMVDWDDYKRNFYDKDGNFAPNGEQRNLEKYPDSSNGSITLILQKETTTFGTLMPNVYQKPANGDKFVVIGISLPTSYITSAETRLETEMKKYMRDNNVYYYEYPLKFDEHFLISNEHILSQMKPNVIVNFEYADVEQSLYIKQMSIKYNESPLPKYDITLTDDVDVVLNKIGEAIAEYRGQRQYENGRGNSETLDGNKFLRKDINDTASGTIRMLKGLQVGERFVTGLLGEGGIFRKDDDGTTYLECDRMYVRMKAYFDTVEVRRFLHSGGNRIASAAGMKCSRVEYIASNGSVTQNVSDAVKFRCYFRAEDNGAKVTNDFVVGDLAYCKETNIDTNLSQHGYWRAVVGVSSNANSSGEHWIDLSKSDCSSTLNDVPIAQDDIIQLGNKTDKTRQGAIVEYVSGEDAPSYQIYQGINTYDLNNKNYIGLGYSSETGRAYMNVYGDMYVGDKNQNTYIKYEQKNPTTNQPKLTIKAVVEMLSPSTGGTTTLDDFASAITTDIENIQSQIDGQIETWFYDGAPTLNNLPASQWPTQSERKNHLGDLYYDTVTGYGYRFANTGTELSPVFGWLRITDVDVVKALADAAKAQDTADHKRRVFVAQPTPPYDDGDLWVNATYVDQTTQETVYDDDILKCITPKAEGGSFSINDWELASKYTDDTGLRNFINGSYAETLSQIQNQIDHKAQTFYLGFDPSYSWEGEEEQHIGDLWYCTNDIPDTGFKKNTTWIYQERIDPDTGETDYYWAEAAVPDEVFDMIDGKSAIFTTWNAWIDESGASCLQVNDLLIPSADIIRGNVTYKQNKVYKCTNTNIQNPVFVEIAYTDDSKVNAIINQYGTILNISSPTAENVGSALAYLRQVLGGSTQVDGGLVLTSLISMRDTASTPKIWGGISGTYKVSEETTIGNYKYLGHGTAAWYGGAMVDYEGLTTAQKSQGWSTHRWAKSLFRFDGSGYVAGGNLKWDASGNVTIQGYSINATTLQVGGSSVATQSMLDNYISKAFFNRLFTAYDANGNPIVPNNTTTAINNLKILVGTWTEQYLSALGINPNGSGGGTPIDLEGILASLYTVKTMPSGTGALYYSGNDTWSFRTDIDTKNTAGATQSTSKLFLVGATAQGANPQTYSNAKVYIGTDSCLYSNNTKVATTSDLSSYLKTTDISAWAKESTKPTYSWREITSKPTTLAGYGITDAKIANGVITLGSNTITPLTDAKIKNDYTWWGQKLNTNGVVKGDLTDVDGVYINNNRGIYFKNTNGDSNILLGFNANNNVTIGYGTASGGSDTHLYGNYIYFRYGTGRTIGATITPTGNVGIGKTDPQAKLDVDGSLRLNGGIEMPRNGGFLKFYLNDTDKYVTAMRTFVNSDTLSLGYETAQKSFDTNIYGNNIGLFHALSNGNASIGIYIDSLCNVGIRTSNPTQTLDVNGAMRATGEITSNSGLTVVDANNIHDMRMAWVTIDSVDYFNMYAYETKYWNLCIGYHLNAASYGALVLDAAGQKWGIGTLEPKTKLDINGGVKADKIYLVKPNANNDTGAIYLEKTTINSLPAVHLVGAGFYSDSFVSALGTGGSSSGGSGMDEDVMWQALATPTTSTSQKQIDVSHLSTALSTYAKTSQLGSYLPLSGGELTTTAQITQKGVVGLWYNGRDNALARIETYEGYKPIFSIKTTNGSWEMGVHTSDNLFLTYMSDTNYSSHKNTYGWQLGFPHKTGTLAVTTDLNNYLPLTGGTVRGNITLQNSNATRGVTPTSNTARGYIFTDVNGKGLGRLENKLETGGRNCMYIWTLSHVSGADAWGGLCVYNDVNIEATKITYLNANTGDLWGLRNVTANGTIQVENTTADAVWVKATNKNGTISLARGLDNRGVFEDTLSKWLIYTNGTNTYLPLGNVEAAGTMKATHFIGTADYAQGLTTQATITYPSNVSGATVGYVLVGTAIMPVGKGGYRRGHLSFAVHSRHDCAGIYHVSYGCEQAVANFSLEKAFAEIKYFGTVQNKRSDNANLYCYMKQPNGVGTDITVYIFWRNVDYSPASISLLGRDGNTFVPSNGVWLTSIDANTYGTLKASARNNVASSLQTARKLWGQSFDGTADVNGNIYMNFNTGIFFKNSAGDTNLHGLVFNGDSKLLLGYGTAGANYTTLIYGKDIHFYYSSSRTAGISLRDWGSVGIGTTTPDRNYKLHVAGNTKITGSLQIGDATIYWDTQAQGLRVTKGLFSEQWISALGANSSGSGGGGGVGDVTWDLLASNSDTRPIALSHIQVALASYTPSTATTATNATKLATTCSLWGRSFDGTQDITGAMSGVTNINSILYFNTTNIGIGTPSPLTKLYVDGTVTATGFATSGGTSSEFLKADGSVDTNTYMTGISNGTVTNAMLAGSIANNKLANSSITVNGTSISLGGSGTTTKWGASRNITIKDSSSTNSGTAVGVDGSGAVTLLLPATIKATLSGNATTATQLSDATAKTAWGQTFFTGGKPTSISNAPLSGVTNIDSLLYFDSNRIGVAKSTGLTYRMHVLGGVVAEYADSTYKGGFRAVRGSYVGAFGVDGSGKTVFTVMKSDDYQTTATAVMNIAPYNATVKYVNFPVKVNINTTSTEGILNVSKGSTTDFAIDVIGQQRFRDAEGDDSSLYFGVFASNKCPFIRFTEGLSRSYDFKFMPIPSTGTATDYYFQVGNITHNTNLYAKNFKVYTRKSASDATEVQAIQALMNGRVLIGSDTSLVTANADCRLIVDGNICTGSANNSFIKIGGAKLIWDGNALKCDHDFYSTGAVSALGSNSGGSGGGAINLLNVPSNIVPSTSNSYTIGTTSRKWSYIYATNGEYSNVTTTTATIGGTLTVGSSITTSQTLTITTGGTLTVTGGQTPTVNAHTFSGTRFTGNTLNISGTSNLIGNVGIGANSNGSYKLYVNGVSYLNDNVGIGGYDNSYKLYVNGTSMFRYNMGIGGAPDSDADVRLRVDGDVKAISFIPDSDIRKKDVVNYVTTNKIEDIAKIPIFNFTWKKREKKTLHLGTSAQYIREVFPNAVTQFSDGYFGLDYGATALAAAVITARKVVDHELRIKQLEQENAILRKEIEELKAA